MTQSFSVQWRLFTTHCRLQSARGTDYWVLTTEHSSLMPQASGWRLNSELSRQLPAGRMSVVECLVPLAWCQSPCHYTSSMHVWQECTTHYTMLPIDKAVSKCKWLINQKQTFSTSMYNAFVQHGNTYFKFQSRLYHSSSSKFEESSTDRTSSPLWL